MTGQKELTLDEPMVLADCDFLRSVYLPYAEDSDVLELDSLSTEEVQDFANAFKVLDGKKIYNIVSLRNLEHYLPRPCSFFMICRNSLQLLTMLVIK